MNIEFSDHDLERAGISISEATRLFGAQIGRKYIQRLAILRAADKFSQLFGIRSLRLHPLKGERAGQHAITLTDNYRLIIERIREDRIRILKVEDYHGN